MAYDLAMHMNTCFPELGPLAEFCNQQSEGKNSHQIAQIGCVFWFGLVCFLGNTVLQN